MPRALVTGARGFIGRHAIPALLERGFDVDAVSSRRYDGPAQSGVRWHQVDLTDALAARRLIAAARPSHLLHLAWNVEHGAFWTSPENERWRQASLALVDAFDGERVVGAGTCAEYDWSEEQELLREDRSMLAPSTPYGLAKDSLRAAAQELLGQRGISFAWGRIFFLHGPCEHPDRLVPSVVRALLAGVPAKCTDGTQVRDFLHSSDAARGFVALLSGDVEGAVNIASGEGVAVATLVGWIGEALGRGELIELGALPTRPGEPRRLVADVARLAREVGFTPTYAPRAALEQSVSWWVRRAAARGSLPDGR